LPRLVRAVIADIYRILPTSDAFNAADMLRPLAAPRR
jgi:hypothetical protein